MLALLSVSPKKWPNTPKQLNCLSVFDDFVGLMLKGLTALKDLTIKIIFLLRLFYCVGMRSNFLIRSLLDVWHLLQQLLIKLSQRKLLQKFFFRSPIWPTDSYNFVKSNTFFCIKLSEICSFNFQKKGHRFLY